MVSIPGGEPLLHPDIAEIVRGLVAPPHYIYPCTHALLLKDKLVEGPFLFLTPILTFLPTHACFLMLLLHLQINKYYIACNIKLLHGIRGRGRTRAAHCLGGHAGFRGHGSDKKIGTGVLAYDGQDDGGEYASVPEVRKDDVPPTRRHDSHFFVDIVAQRPYAQICPLVHI